MRTTTSLGLAAGSALILLLAGCGGSATTPQVAAIPTHGAAPARAASSPSPTGNVEDERPLIRPDMSQAEQDRLQNAYEQCMANAGWDKTKLLQEVDQGSKTMADFNHVYHHAVTACASVEPEEWWERAQREDPDWNDELHAWVACLVAHGIDAEVDDGALAFKTGLPAQSQMPAYDRCELEAIPKV